MEKFFEMPWDYDTKERQKYINNLAPIVLFVYNRLDHTQKTIAALQKNIYASDSMLIVFSDGPKNNADSVKISNVRNFIKKVAGFKKVLLIEHETNRGLAFNIITGVTCVMDEFGKAIILEDDIVTSKYFLKYMNDALTIYNDYSQVMAVNAYMEPIAKDELPEVFFTGRGDCWGWGTWKRCWDFFEKNPQKLISTCSDKEIAEFSFDGYLDNWEQVNANYAGQLNTWAIFWLYTIYKNNGLVVQIRDSLIENIGYDTGEHTYTINQLHTSCSDKPVKCFPTQIAEEPLYKERIKAFMRKGNPHLPYKYTESHAGKQNAYCTLFDSGYLLRALAMYDSLAQYEDSFVLYIFAFDDLAYTMLQKLALPKAIIIPLKNLEEHFSDLKRIRQERTWQEYCWTCSCHTLLYIIEHFPVDEITYIDADLYFFASPKRLLNEFHATGKDVLITPHRFSPEYSHLSANGIYCVQFMTFKNTPAGLDVLEWWCERCREWCYNHVEGILFGDQGYLNDWPERFACVHVLRDIGGAGPWNIQQHLCETGPNIDGIPVIFYHFSGVKYIGRNNLQLMHYRIPDEAQQLFYLPYLSHLDKCLDKIEKIFLH